MKNCRLLLSTLALLMSQLAVADNLWCTGTVKRQYVDSSSRMYILGSWHPSYTMICDLDTTWQGITPELCKSWFAMLQGAYYAQTIVIVFYSNAAYANCADLPHYAGTPAPGYVMNRD